MTRARILAAEDEAVIAMDLRQRLEGLGYEVAGVVATGEEAIARATELRPELVLMDIRLGGRLDGVAAADEIRRRLDLPVVFVTAHSDAATLARAKVTEPFGYLLKPYEDRELETTIEIALYKHAADAKLRRVERWMASTLRSLGDAVIATDVEGRVTWLSPAAEQLTGWSPTDAVGRPFREVFAARDPATGRSIDDPVARVLREGLVVGLAPGTVLATRDGRDVPIEDSAAPLRDERGEVTGVVVCFRDATRHAATLEELRRTQVELRQSQKLEALGRMSGGIAHDFNNLLTAIGGFTELVLDRLPPGPERERLEEVTSATRRAAGLTGQLLAFSRKQHLSPQVLDPNAVVADMERLLGRVIGDDVKLRALPGAAWRVKVDRSQLEQVIVNLAVNARDAMPGGGTLTIQTSDVVLGEAYVHAHPDAAPGPHVLLAFSDAGHGMDHETLARCFEPFFTTKGEVGTGLGLATVYGIVRQSGGHVLAFSEPRRGARFEVYLPRAEAPEAPPAPAPAEAPGGTETVLVAEDEAAVRALIGKVLGASGYQVLEAASGPDALARAREFGGQLDLLVTDVVMPEMNGPVLAEELRRARPGVAVLFMSGYAGDTLERQVLPTDASFLQKPFTIMTLREAVRKALDARGRRAP